MSGGTGLADRRRRPRAHHRDRDRGRERVRRAMPSRCWRISPESRSGTVRRVNPSGGLSNRRGCPELRGLSDRGLRQQHPGLLGRPDARLPGITHRVLHRSDHERVWCGDHRRQDRSTVPATPRCTSTSGSSRNSRIGSGRRGDRSRRRTSWRTSTVIMSRTSSGSSATDRGGGRGPRRSVRTELQADCYAGVWAATPSRPGSSRRHRPGRRRRARCGRAVGDDRIQRETQGQVNRETWTHGSSAERHGGSGRATPGGPNACDTFSGSV